MKTICSTEQRRIEEENLRNIVRRREWEAKRDPSLAFEAELSRDILSAFLADSEEWPTSVIQTILERVPRVAREGGTWEKAMQKVLPFWLHERRPQ